MQEDSTAKEMRRQLRMKVMKDMMMKNRSKGRMDAENRWWVAELSMQKKKKKKPCRNGMSGWRR